MEVIDVLREVLQLGSEYFKGNTLLGFVALYYFVKYVLLPIHRKSKKIEEFMDALIEALHERVYSSRGTEDRLKDINETLNKPLLKKIF